MFFSTQQMRTGRQAFWGLICSVALWCAAPCGLHAQAKKYAYPDDLHPLSTFEQWPKNKTLVRWVDSVYQQLSVEERIGQFFMLPAYTQGRDYNMDTVLAQVKRGQAGGVIFFKGNPSAQAMWTNRLQDSSRVNVMVAVDGEWGLSMRVDSTPVFPRQMTLGAVADNNLIYQMGREIGAQCRRLGVHINFAPVVDVNNNPNNPVINERSFGENKYQVSLKGLEYAEGLQHEGVLACAKHFPGHGDTDKDSHKELPSVMKPATVLDTMELFPFKVLFKNQIGSVMVAHLNVPALDNDTGSVASLSRKIATGLLQDSMRFKGLVFSDALNMKGVSKFYKPGTVDSIAFMAGLDILVFSENAPEGIRKIKMAVDSGIITQEQLEYRVKKVLAFKYLLGLNQRQWVDTKNLVEDINNTYAQVLRQQLFEQAITVAANQDNLLPFKAWNYKKVASLSIGTKNAGRFQDHIYQFAEMDLYNLPSEVNPVTGFSMLDKLAAYELVVVDLHDMVRLASKEYGITASAKKFIEELSGRTKVVLVVFGNAYSLKNFDFIPWVVCAYEDNDATNRAAANALFGAQKITGRLPVTASATYKAGTGFLSDTIYRLKISYPEEVELNTAALGKMDAVITEAIRKKAMPGCQVLVAKEGKVIWNKTYGNKTYELNDAVQPTDLYDLASITKVAATTLAVMKLYEEKKLSLNDRLDELIELPRNATIRHLKVKDILTHQAGLKAFFPYWKETVGTKRAQYYRNVLEKEFTVPVADSLFIRNDYPDTIWQKIYMSEVDDHPKYVYSDLDFYILQKIVEQQSGLPLNEYVQQHFYQPMGLTRISYTPAAKFDRQRIAPTENDTAFRKQIVRGYVQDPGAAMYGGVAGHAGLFGNAFDLAALFEMLLNDGIYNGQRLLKESTIKAFTSRYSKVSRRGLGFDKPEPDVSKPSPCYDGVPLSVFGHTGFTGTCVWSDPENHLTYIFLSNRVYPNAENNMLTKLSVRTELQGIIYKALDAANTGR